MNTLVDVITELAPHRWTFDLMPDQWVGYGGPLSLTWSLKQLVKASAAKIPTRSGIYLLILTPSITACDTAYLMYVGKASNLRTRFRAYLTTERKKRPKVVRLLNLYPDHLWFRFCPVSKAKLDKVENALIQAFMPPCNDEIEGEIGRARRAFP